LRQIGLALQMYHDSMETLPAGYIYVPDPSPGGPGFIGHRPPPISFIISHRPGWGWAALILQHLEQDALWHSIDFKLAVESPTNLPARTTLQKVYTCPTDQNTGVFTVLTDKNTPLADAATNSYAACFGAFDPPVTPPFKGNGLFFRNSAVRIADI